MTDKELIHLYLSKKDDTALQTLIERHMRSVYRFIYLRTQNPHDAEDITQETFVRAWKHLTTFDSEKKFKTWVFAIAKNATLDFLKKKKTIPFSEFDTINGNNILLDTLQDTAERIDTILRKKDDAQLLAPALAQLPPKYQKVLLLRHTDDLSFRTMAEKLHESIHTTKSKYRRALKILKSALSPHD